MSVLGNFLASLKRFGAVKTLDVYWERATTRFHEWRLGIRTDAIVRLRDLGMDAPGRKDYAATTYSGMRSIIRTIGFDVKDHVFLDLGAGMGRAMILAARFPFKGVLGVEVSPQLAEIAKENIAKCRNKLACQAIELVVADAAGYRIPTSVTVVYCFNPFAGPVLKAVLDNILVSLRAKPRELWLVCNVPAGSSEFETEVHLRSWLVFIKAVALRGVPRCAIFRANLYQKIPSTLHR